MTSNMAAALKRPVERTPEHGGGPPTPPRFIVQRDIVERRDGALMIRPYYRWRSGNPLIEMIDGEWAEFNQPEEEMK